jgi:hypothetical protein
MLVGVHIVSKRAAVARAAGAAGVHVRLGRVAAGCAKLA